MSYKDIFADILLTVIKFDHIVVVICKVERSRPLEFLMVDVHRIQ